VAWNRGGTKGGTVAGELKQLWEGEQFTVYTPGETPLCILFDPKHPSFVGGSLSFGEKKRYRDVMTLVAMALSLDQWKELQTQSTDGPSSRSLLDDVEKATPWKVKELEVQWGLSDHIHGRGKAKPGLNSLGIRFKNLKTKISKSGIDVADIIARLTGKHVDGSHLTVKTVWRGK
jgi:hypothetical protein